MDDLSAVLPRWVTVYDLKSGLYTITLPERAAPTIGSLINRGGDPGERGEPVTCRTGETQSPGQHR